MWTDPKNSQKKKPREEEMGSRIEQSNGRDFHKNKQAKLTTLATVMIREVRSRVLFFPSWINQKERAQTDAAATDALPAAPTTTVTNATRRRQARSLSLSPWLGSGFEHATLGSRRLNPSQ